MRDYLLGLAVVALIFLWALYVFDPETFHHYVDPLVFSY